MKVGDLGWTPFVGPELMKALVAHVLLTEGVEIISCDLSDIHDGTPVYVLAHRDLEDVIARLYELNARVIPVVRGGKVLGFFDMPAEQLRQASA